MWVCGISKAMLHPLWRANPQNNYTLHFLKIIILYRVMRGCQIRLRYRDDGGFCSPFLNVHDNLPWWQPKRTSLIAWWDLYSRNWYPVSYLPTTKSGSIRPRYFLSSSRFILVLLTLNMKSGPQLQFHEFCYSDWSYTPFWRGKPVASTEKRS